jgi:hypothetical protein
MKLTKNFELKEFVSPELFKQFGEKSIWFLDPCIVQFAQTFRDHIGRSVIINNWHTGGKAKYSGHRPLNCEIGASLSQHKFGRAVDIKVEGFSGAELRKIIVSNYDKLFSDYITTIEDGTDTWLHADCRWTESDKLLIVPFR